jgi:peptidoglycan-N-acetylglucosamine deacetylase
MASIAASLMLLAPVAGRPIAAARAVYGQRSRILPSPPAPGTETAREVWGFFAPWDPRSAASVAGHRSAMSVVVSGWLRLDSASGQPTLAYHDSVRGSRRLRRFALVTTYAGSRFHPEVVRMLGTDPALRARVASAIAHRASSGGYHGLVLDFEALTPADSDALTAVVRAITDSAHRHGVRPVAVAVPPADTVLYGHQHLRAADLLLVMLYDQHWSTGTPGPIASPDWARQYLAAWVAEAGARRIVAALPVYGYLWKAPQPATVLSFPDALREVEVAGVPLARDSASSSLYFVRPDSAQGWVSDAVLVNILMHDAAAVGVHRFALWRLGLEDPAIWARH